VVKKGLFDDRAVLVAYLMGQHYSCSIIKSQIPLRCPAR